MIRQEALACYGNLFSGSELEVIGSWGPVDEQRSIIYACPELYIYICQFDWFVHGRADITIGHLSNPPSPSSWGQIISRALHFTRVPHGGLPPRPVFSHRNEVLALVLADLCGCAKVSE